jgi:farnesyl diphosphate synthase
MSELVLKDGTLASGIVRIQREIDSLFDALLPVPGDARARLFEAIR